MAASRSGQVTAELLNQIMAENADLGEHLHLQSLQALSTKKGALLEDTEYVRLFDNGVAVASLFGAIYPRANMMTASGATSVSTFVGDVLKAYNNDDVRAIVLDIDSPGGDVRGVGDGADMIYQMAQDGKKPIKSFVSGYMASAAYYLGSTTHQIVSSKSGLVGSIGVVLKAHKNAENEIEIVSSISPHKRPNAFTDEGRAVLQEQVNDLGEIFKSDVMRYRGITSDYFMSNYGQGAVKVGPRAKSSGLIDEIGTLGELVEDIGIEAKSYNKKRKYSRANASALIGPASLLEFTEEEKNDMGLQNILNKFKASNETIVEDANLVPETTTEEKPEGGDQKVEGPQGNEKPEATTAPALETLPEPKPEGPTREQLEERFSDSAELFAVNMTTDSRIWPSEQVHAATDLLNAKIDDVLFGGTVKFVNAEGILTEGTREASVRARYMSRPKHNLAEQSIAGLKSGSVVGQILAESDKESTKEPEIVTEERKRQLLASSPQGQAVLAQSEK